jgi:cell division transport system permease protein
MKSIKNHLSLVIALLSILFSIQIFIVVDRSITTYKHNLATNYAVVVVSQKKLDTKQLKQKNTIIDTIEKLSPDSVIKKLNTGMSKKNIEFLKLTLPKFYKIKLTHFPSTTEVDKLTSNLKKDKNIKKIESFSNNHDTTYKLLVLFKTVISAFALVMIVVTILLIFKELRIWQFKHNERMNIMGLFGAPTWLRSAVLFRLAIVDALIASALTFVLFSIISTNEWVLEQFKTIGISIVIFDPISDFLILLGIALILSMLLASFIVLGHKEEV